jgi:hypothetical protein
MKTRSVLALLLVGALLVGCGGSKATPTQPSSVANTPVVASPTSLPTAASSVPTAASAQATAAAEEIELANSSNLDKLDSYHAAYSWKWTETKDGSTTTGFWDATEAYSRADSARHSIWSGTDGSFETISIGQVAYFRGDDDEWLSMFSSEESPFGSTAFLADPLSAISGNKGRLVQRGMSVNGVTADHYKLAESSGGFLAFGVADKMDGDVYISPQYDIVVKYVAHYEGAKLGLSGGTNGVLDVTFDLTDINRPVKIEPPEGVAPPIAEDIPIVEGATEITAMAGNVSYRTTLSVEAVTTFYNEQMKVLGWKAEEPMAGMLTYSKEARQAIVMIQAETDYTSVTVIAAAE